MTEREAGQVLSLLKHNASVAVTKLNKPESIDTQGIQISFYYAFWKMLDFSSAFNKFSLLQALP